MTAQIDWQQKRLVVEDIDTAETYVKVGGRYMLIEDYVEEGGPSESLADADLAEVGYLTNVEIQTYMTTGGGY